jgi:hypothetical protein
MNLGAYFSLFHLSTCYNYRMGQPRPRILTGARAIIKIDDSVVVFATSVSYTVDTEFKEIQGVDESMPEELAPTNIRVEVRCTNLRVPMESAAVLGLQPTILSHLQQRYVAIDIRDRMTDKTILYVPKAMLVRRDGTVGTRQLATETWTLKGIGYWDERPPEEAKDDTSSWMTKAKEFLS